ncbi:hypothetical protein ACFE04_017208 [Oxalis oulophora]
MDRGKGKFNKNIHLKETFQKLTVSATARNLRKSDLGGVIFGCKDNTIKECYDKQLFGLPASHYSYVKNVCAGLPLFLFNYSDRQLHGIFEAVGHGQLNIDPYAWTGRASAYNYTTDYPAQVKVKVRMLCKPLKEEQFGREIADNYYERRLFCFELDVAQTKRLISLFQSSAVPSTRSSLPPKMLTSRSGKKWNTSDGHGLIGERWVPKNRVTESHSEEVALQGQDCKDSGKPLSSPFGTGTNPDAIQEVEIFDGQALLNESSSSGHNLVCDLNSNQAELYDQIYVQLSSPRSQVTEVALDANNGGVAEDVLSRLLHEVQELKSTQSEHDLKITFLEKELAQSSFQGTIDDADEEDPWKTNS